MRFNLAAFILLAPFSASAHEFWIAPESYLLSREEPLAADLKVGQDFTGRNLIYNESKFSRFEVIPLEGSENQTIVLNARLGDRPALQNLLLPKGSWLIVYESNADFVTYRDFALFEEFVQHKALAGVLERHTERELPQTGFVERYFRYSKSLVGVETDHIEDHQLGLVHEIILQTELKAGVEIARAEILENGSPRAAAQLEVFARAPDGTLKIDRLISDDMGVVEFPVEAGTEYMLDAVLMREIDPTNYSREAVWESHWANLTFEAF